LLEERHRNRGNSLDGFAIRQLSFIEFLPALVSASCLRRELVLKELPVEDGQIQRGP
jgi:hypothetical protein